MDISFSQEQEVFRVKAREWLNENIPEEWKQKQFILTEQEKVSIMRSWDHKLYEGGYSGISWPTEYGGRGLSLAEEIIFEEECGKADAPRGLNFVGKILLGPTLLKYGTEKQKKRFLPPLLKGEEIWCQGFSEPNAGSDLASLQMKATLDGENWILDGQKIWTSVAQYADWCFVLARTDSTEKKHKGITYFLVPMNTEGISVRPITKINGEKDFNEVFFNNVKIPKDSYIGELNGGWKVAMGTLSFERGVLPLGRQSRFQNEFDHLCELTEKLTNNIGTKIKDDPHFRQKLAQCLIELRIMRYHGLKVISKLMNTGNLGPEVSMLKLYWTEMHTEIGRLAMEIQNSLGVSAEPQLDSYERKKFQHIYLTTKGETIYAGTNQIQKNIISELVLGMPK